MFNTFFLLFCHVCLCRSLADYRGETERDRRDVEGGVSRGQAVQSMAGRSQNKSGELQKDDHFNSECAQGNFYWIQCVMLVLYMKRGMITLCASPQGIFLAFKVNWLDDPKLKDIVMNMEAFPYLGIKEVDLVSQ